ncbi:unnamed protein product [Lactuca virosa]|uniref:Uncharacterized protein n=1 Tax=Lactuca virosa TaxID=75947 RepID=A0AAU9MWK4_9ASTR|nr:unnamed protein product [Lactuca virosa]
MLVTSLLQPDGFLHLQQLLTPSRSPRSPSWSTLRPPRTSGTVNDPLKKMKSMGKTDEFRRKRNQYGVGDLKRIRV